MIVNTSLLMASRLSKSTAIRGMTNPEMLRAGTRTMATFIASRPGSSFSRDSLLIARRPASTAATKTPRKPQPTIKKPAASKEKTPEQKARAEARKEKTQAAEQKRSDRAKALREKEKAKKEKEKEKARLAKEKEAAKKLREKERAQKAKAKAKSKPAKKWELKDEKGNKIPLPIANKPARSGSFVQFIQQEVAENKNNPAFVGENGSFSAALLIKSAAQKWKDMSDAQKQPFKEAADKHNADYPRRLAEWEQSLSQVDIMRLEAWDAERRKVSKASNKRAFHPVAPRDPTRPIRPLTAFFRFLSDYRAKSPVEEKFGELSKNASAEWRTLSEEEKRPYEESAAKDMKLWSEANKKWLEQRGL